MLRLFMHNMKSVIQNKCANFFKKTSPFDCQDLRLKQQSKSFEKMVFPIILFHQAGRMLDCELST